MMRRKNLERAIVLGLLLSTSVYGSAWAEGRIFSDNVAKIVETGDLVITDSMSALGFNGNVDVKNGDLIINTEGYNIANGIESGYLNNAKLNILAKNVFINAGANGIITTWGDPGVDSNSFGNVIIGTEENTIQELKIESGGQGIDNKRGTVTIYGSDNSIIDIYSKHTSGDDDKQSAINVGSHHDTISDIDNIVILKGGIIKLKADGGDGITNGALSDDEESRKDATTNLISKKVTIEASIDGINNVAGTVTLDTTGNNIINAQQTAVHNSGSGTITISATAGTGDEGISTLANYEDYNNELVGGINGVQSDSTGTTNVIADNNNIIAGKENGILSDGAGIINVTAGNNNTIGQYTDENGNVVNSEVGVNIEKGVVNIYSGNDTTIYAIDKGINVERDGTIKINDVESSNSNTALNIIVDSDNIGKGIYTVNYTNVDIDVNRDVYISAKGEEAYGIHAYANNSEININAQNDVTIKAEANRVSDSTSNEDYGSYAISSPYNFITINAGNNLNLQSTATDLNRSYGFWVMNQGNPGNAVNELSAENIVNIAAELTINNFDKGQASSAGIYEQGDGSIAHSTNIFGGNGVNIVSDIVNNSMHKQTHSYGVYATTTSLNIESGEVGSEIVSDDEPTIIIGASNKSVDRAEDNLYASTARGIYAFHSNDLDHMTTIRNNNGSTYIYGIGEDSANGYGIYMDTYGQGKNTVDITSKKDTIVYSSDYAAVVSGEQSRLAIYSDNSNIFKADDVVGTYILNNGTLNIEAGADNIIQAGDIDAKGFGTQRAIYALSGASATIDAAQKNNIAGAVHANGIGTIVDVQGLNDTSSKYNDIRSASSIANAGGLKDTTVISALYAEAGAQINVSGENNTILSYADYDKPEILERAVWAYDRADITIDGATTISTDSYEKSSNSNDIAIAAGTGTGLTEEIVSAPVADRSTVTLTYNNYANGAKSNITGNILSAYTGTVDIKGVNDSAGIYVTGDLLAGNNGELNLNLGNGGILKGRADDYGDAGVVNNGHANTFKDPAFSSEIHKGGVVNLTMGDNSRWNVTGQSWITSITTDHEEENAEHNHIIDLISANTDRNEAAHALTVYNFDGNATFNMSLDADRSISDMLYIKNADGNYIINVVDAVTEDDIYAAKSDGGTFDGLRFATVGKGSTASFKAITYDQGFNNIEYMIGTDSYNESDENHHYNGESLNTEKPGDETVDEFFENEGTPGSTTESTNGIATASLMLAAANEAGNAAAGTTAEADDLTDVEVNTDETTNFKLIGVKNTDISDGGETILNMSRANYSNAIYMDRLNKRLGEARYINDDPEEDEGMWVRIRHDRIGKEDAFRSQNTMYQLGYDKRQECDNGERRVGFAVDYMHGDTGYTDIAGKGEIDRYGLWLYDTWMGDKGHYADYIAKWGHLDNEFEIYAPTTGERIDGDYSNNVFSVSAEYGRKKDIGNDWYFEPQAQLQLARVTGAEYTTSQGTKVSVDGINSLIGRAGFRIGKDFGEEKQSTLYFKADVLHEFLGDQDISAMDKTTNGNWSTISYENEGTWYDIGIGYAAMMSKSSYAFIDLEQSFGNDNDDTYQINSSDSVRASQPDSRRIVP